MFGKTQIPADRPLNLAEAAQAVLKSPGFMYAHPKFIAVSLSKKVAIIIPGDFKDSLGDAEELNKLLQDTIINMTN